MMKKRGVILSMTAFVVLLCFLVIMGLMGKKDRIIFLEEYSHYSLRQEMEEFGFSLKYIYRGKKPEVKFLHFDSLEADALLEWFGDDSLEVLKGKKYRGYGYAAVGFRLDLSVLKPGEELQIQSITLLVDGKERTLYMDDAITVAKYVEDEKLYQTDSVYFTTVALMMQPHAEPFEGAPYYYQAVEDVVITGFGFRDFLRIMDSAVCIDGTEIGKIENVFPLEVTAGQEIWILVSGDYGKYSPYSDFYTDAMLYYTDAGNEERILKVPVTVEAVTTFEDFKALVDHIIF